MIFLYPGIVGKYVGAALGSEAMRDYLGYVRGARR